MYNSKIVGFESYIPERIVTNAELSTFLDTSDDWIRTRTGIEERRISCGLNTSDMCAEAASKLIKKIGIDVLDIDLIIVATMTPDYLTPSTACIVQGKIGASNAFAFDINAACSGFVFALSAADKFIKAGGYKNALVFGAETNSKIIDWNDRSTAVIFGDGAGCVLLSNGDKNSVLAEDIHSDGYKCKAITSCHLPVKNAFVENNDVENNDFYMQMNGKEVFNFTLKIVPKSIKSLVDKAGISFDDIKYIVPHQANSRIVDGLAKKLSLDISKFYLNINRFGNTSAASIPIALNEMMNQNLINDGDKIIISGFGSGLTWASLLLEF